MDREALWDMVVFREVATRGTLSGAARALGVTPSAVSKQVTRLEARLGVRLVQRTTRSLQLTAAGTRYKGHAERLLVSLEEAEADVQGERDILRGRVRVSAPTMLGQEIVAPIAARFLVTHPEVEVELDLSDRLVDLVAEQVDLAVRVVPTMESSGLSSRRLGMTEWHLVASPAYVAARGMPASVGELAAHACLELSHAQDRGTWELQVRGRATRVLVQARLLSSSIGALHRCALEGAGIGRFPEYLVRKDLEAGRLVRVLPRVVSSRRPVYALQPTRAFVAPRVRAFASFLAEQFPRTLAQHGEP
ncbi:LysR family transcriptional regulator [Chondromyces apiculatus]|uniref:Transcriptional regulator, LysR family n=1 Tax=Chondromyces apiculatus DSM 436 TaxID=1192034 RepID=A0A017ST92_9BACT|nr:LysR family transcriptional regulator [Chondromyces apiculatus]EYF00213.1 Transcriptional regulator, LysR family [Chondromyces apiculatus DSM 436]